jgi:protein TonB
VVAKREEPAQPPVTAKREERPAVFPKPEERPVPVAPVAKAAAPPPAPPKVEEPPKREERPAVQPIAVKREEPAPAPPPEKKEERKEQRAAVAAATPKMEPAPAAIPVKAPEPLVVAAAEPAKSGKLWIGIGAVAAVLLLGVGLYTMRSHSTPSGTTQSETSLGLKVERDAGGLVLSWNRNAEIVKTAQKATLTITDGASTEDDDIDLGTLRAGSILYSPLTNDVGFKFEVSDLKNRRSVSESIRALQGTARSAPPAPVVAQIRTPPVVNPVPPVSNPTGTQTPAQHPVTPPILVSTQPAGELGRRLFAAPPTPTTAPEPPPVTNASINSERQNPVAPQVVAPPQAPTPVKVAEAQQPPTPIPAPVKVVQQTPAPAPLPVAPPPPIPGGNLVAPRVISKVAPVYPPMAIRMGISGSVRVEATVGKDGKIKAAKATSGPQVLRAAAENAVRQWKYVAGTLNGQPEESPVTVNVDFNRR